MYINARQKNTFCLTGNSRVKDLGGSHRAEFGQKTNAGQNLHNRRVGKCGTLPEGTSDCQLGFPYGKENAYGLGPERGASNGGFKSQALDAANK